MAKALLGHVTLASDPRLVAEVSRLRSRVKELEAELDDVRGHLMIEAPDTAESLTLSEPEPAYS